MSNELIGGYSPYTCKISEEAKKAFKEAMTGFIGAQYTPVAVSSQVVQGTNYKFFCNVQYMNIIPPFGAAIVSIYAPLQGTAHITHIQSL